MAPPQADRCPALLFVYNADSGAGNALLDIGHKIISPSTYNCRLCALTHGLFKMREGWQAFVQRLPLPAQFLHRDEFHARHGMSDVPLPAVFRCDTDDTLTVFLSAADIGATASLPELEAMLLARLGAAQALDQGRGAADDREAGNEPRR